jgi:hypothetical protein
MKEELAKAQGRAEKLLSTHMWLAAWIAFKTDLQGQNNERLNMVLNLGDTLAKYLMDMCLEVKPESDEALALKALSTLKIRAMIKTACDLVK